MKPHQPLLTKTGRTLTPSLIATNLRQTQTDIDNSLAKRYTHSSFVLDFSGVANTSAAAELLYRFTTPAGFFYEVESVDLVVFEATGTVTLVKAVLAVGLDSYTVEVEPAGATTRASASEDFQFLVAENTSIDISLEVTAGGAYTLDACKVVVNVRCDRGNMGSSHLGYHPDDLPGTGSQVSRTNLNTEFMAIAAAAARDTANDRCGRIEVRTRRNIAVGAMPASDSTWPIFVGSDVRRLAAVAGGVVCAATSSLRFGLKNQSGSELSGLTVVGTASATFPATGLQAGIFTLPTGETGEGSITRASGTDAVSFAYLVLFWT